MFAKKLIPKLTQFGPFVAPTAADPPKAAVGKFLLMVLWTLFAFSCCCSRSFSFEIANHLKLF